RIYAQRREDHLGGPLVQPWKAKTMMKLAVPAVHTSRSVASTPLLGGRKRASFSLALLTSWAALSRPCGSESAHAPPVRSDRSPSLTGSRGVILAHPAGRGLLVHSGQATRHWPGRRSSRPLAAAPTRRRGRHPWKVRRCGPPERCSPR